MTDAQLAVTPRLLYIGEQTPETLLLKGTGGISGKGWNNENSCEHKKDKQREEGTWSADQAIYVARQSGRTRLKLSEYFIHHHLFKVANGF